MDEQLQLILDPPPRRRRRVPAWQVEQGKLKAWQAQRRKADQGPPWRVADAWPQFGASLEKLRLILRVEAEARRCGCPTPYPLS